MSKIKNWNDFLNEDTLSDEEIEKCDETYPMNLERLAVSEKAKKLYEEIKNKLSSINIDDIKLVDDTLNIKFQRRMYPDIKLCDKWFIVKYSDEIQNKIEKLYEELKNNIKNHIKNHKLIHDLTKDEFNDSLNPIVGVIIEYSNRFHWLLTESLPKDLRSLGLGYKIYKAAIRDLYFISSSEGYSNRITAKIWSKLVRDNDLFIALNNGSCVVFNKNCNSNFIKKELYRFFPEATNIAKGKVLIDKELQDYLKLTKEDGILWSIKNISN